MAPEAPAKSYCAPRSARLAELKLAAPGVRVRVRPVILLRPEWAAVLHTVRRGLAYKGSWRGPLEAGMLEGSLQG